jgi:hypothetical protein
MPNCDSETDFRRVLYGVMAADALERYQGNR